MKLCQFGVVARDAFARRSDSCSHEDYTSYREVNAFMARALLRFRKPDSVFWIQDYHFLALGAELRDLGVAQRSASSCIRRGRHAR